MLNYFLIFVLVLFILLYIYVKINNSNHTQIKKVKKINFSKSRKVSIKKLKKESFTDSIKFFHSLLISLLATIFLPLNELINCTTKLIYINFHPETLKLIQDRNSPFILTLWHDRIFYTFYSLKRNLVSKGVDVLGMTSPSRDGEIIARVVRKWGAYATRGSSSRKSTHATRDLLRYASEYFNPLIIADGPLGPAYKAKEGVVFLSRITSLPIIPISYSAKKSWIFKKAWDKFCIPKPFTNVAMDYGAPIYIKKGEDLKKASLNIEETLIKQLEKLDEIVKNS